MAFLWLINFPISMHFPEENNNNNKKFAHHFSFHEISYFIPFSINREQSNYITAQKELVWMAFPHTIFRLESMPFFVGQPKVLLKSHQKYVKQTKNNLSHDFQHTHTHKHTHIHAHSVLSTVRFSFFPLQCNCICRIRNVILSRFRPDFYALSFVLKHYFSFVFNFLIFFFTLLCCYPGK